MTRGGLVVVALLGALGSAAAAPSAEFLAAFQAGTDAFRLGDYAGARGHLERARAIDPSLPGPYRFLAAVDAAEGKWSDCVEHARGAIIANPTSSEIAATRKLHEDCRVALGRVPFTGEYGDGGALAVTSNVAGAALTIAGLKAGATPAPPRAIAVGAVEISADKAGWRTARTTATILPGVVTDVELTLEEAPVDVAIEGGGPAAPTVGWLRVTVEPGAQITIDGQQVAVDDRGRFPLPPGEHEVEVRAPGRVPARSRVRIDRGQERALTPTLVSLGAVAADRRRATVAFVTAGGLVIAGAALAYLSIDAADEARDWAALERARPITVPIGETTAFAPIHTRAEIEARGDTARTLAWVSAGTYVAAAAAAGLAIYWSRSGPGGEPIEVRPTLGDHFGVTVRGALP